MMTYLLLMRNELFIKLVNNPGYLLDLCLIKRTRHKLTAEIIEIIPKINPPLMAAVISFSPILVPIKAIVKPKNKIQSPNRIHFQKGMGILRSSIRILSPITTKQAKIPSKNQKRPLLKKCIASLLYSSMKSSARSHQGGFL